MLIQIFRHFKLDDFPTTDLFIYFLLNRGYKHLDYYALRHVLLSLSLCNTHRCTFRQSACVHICLWVIKAKPPEQHNNFKTCLEGRLLSRLPVIIKPHEQISSCVTHWLITKCKAAALSASADAKQPQSCASIVLSLPLHIFMTGVSWVQIFPSAGVETFFVSRHSENKQTSVLFNILTVKRYFSGFFFAFFVNLSQICICFLYDV